MESNWNHEIKRHLLLERKAVTNLDSILRCRDNTLSTKVHIVKAVVLPVVMYGYESWTLQKAEYWKTDAFIVRCYRRLLSVLDSKEITPVSPKGNQTEYLLEGLMLKLKLQCFAHIMGRMDWLEKTLILGKIQGKRRRGLQRMRGLDSIINSMEINLSKLQDNSEGQGGLACSRQRGRRVRHNLATEQQTMFC